MAPITSNRNCKDTEGQGQGQEEEMDHSGGKKDLLLLQKKGNQKHTEESFQTSVPAFTAPILPPAQFNKL